MATPIYVATVANGGSDANDGEAPTDEGAGVGPKLTIQAAYGVVDASGEVRIQYGTYDLGDGTNDYLLTGTAGKHVDFVGYNDGAAVDNTQVVIQGSIGAGAIVYTVYVNSSGNVLFRDLTIQTATTVNTSAIRWRAAAAYAPNLTLDNVIVTNQSSAGTATLTSDQVGTAITAFADATGGYVTVTAASHGQTNGDTVIIRGTTNYDGFFTVSGVAGNDFNIATTWVANDATGTANLSRDLTITDSVLTGGDHTGVLLETFAHAYLTDSTFTMANSATNTPFRAEEAGEIIAKGCTFTCTTAGIAALRKDENGSVSLTNCTLNNAAGAYVLKLGNDSDVAAQVATDPINRVNIDNCTIQYTGASGGHTVFLGPEVSDGSLTNNYISTPAEDSSTSFGIVTKGSTNCTISGNIILAERPLYFKGNSDNNLIENNTVVAWGTYVGSSCFSWSNIKILGVTYIAENNTTKNNIFEARNGKACVVFVDSTGTPTPATDVNGNVFDYNCLYGDVLLSDVPNANTYTTLATLTAFWGAEAGFPINNDLNSLNVDPQLDSNYKSHNSEVINGGKPDANGDSTSIGAIGATAGGKGRYSGGGRYS